MENKVESKQSKLFLHTNFTMIIQISYHNDQYLF